MSCFRYLGFHSFEQVDQLTIAQYEIMMEALELRMLDESLHEHRQAFLNFAVQAEKKAGPVYQRFQQFFDYENELKKVRNRKKKKASDARFSGIGRIFRKVR